MKTSYRTCLLALALATAGLGAAAQEPPPDAAFVESVLSSSGATWTTVVDVRGCLMEVRQELHLEPRECRNPKTVLRSRMEVDLRTVGQIEVTPVERFMVHLQAHGYPLGLHRGESGWEAREAPVPVSISLLHLDYCDGSEFQRERLQNDTEFFFVDHPISDSDLHRVNAYLALACPLDPAPGS